MSPQVATTERRAYRKTRRATAEQRTRARIVDAAETLHGTVGPARTTVAAIAREAGVTRATVYRHFPDDEALFVACSTQWLSRQSRPEPGAWAQHTDPLERLRAGLADIYRYYRDGEQMLRLVNRDAHAVPPRVVAAREAAERAWVAALVEPFPGRGRVLKVAIRHATSFRTWQSLCGDGALSNRSAAVLMAGMVAAAA